MSNIFTSLTDTESIAFLTHKMHHAQKAINFFPWAKKVLGFDSKYKSLPIKWVFFRFDPCNKCYGLKSAPSQLIGIEVGRTMPCPQKGRPAVSILRARLQIHQLALTVESWKPLLIIWKTPATFSRLSKRSQQSPIYGKVQMLWQMVLQELEALIGQLHPTCHASRETWMIFMSRKRSSNESTSMIRYLIMEGWWIHSCWDLYLVISYII